MKNLKVLGITVGMLLILSSCNKADAKHVTGESNHDVTVKLTAKMPDSIKNNKGEITSYLLEEDIIIGNNNPIFKSNKLVLYINGQDIIGYYGWAAQNSAEYYLKGKKNGNIITGKKYSFDDASVSSEFTLTILPSSIKTNNLSHIIGEQINIPTSKIDFFIENTKNIYELPNRKSKVLASNYNLNNNEFKLIEIGKFEKDEDGYEIWYKIKNKDFEGWVFGLISVFYAD
ncbi:hypothetical protein [Flavobacterium petrolei]|uniref:hypothetical protein n=1 Tax=Flavobacterium petrolei TaxID=2259594 RepID=UPI003756C1B9